MNVLQQDDPIKQGIKYQIDQNATQQAFNFTVDNKNHKTYLTVLSESQELNLQYRVCLLNETQQESCTSKSYSTVQEQSIIDLNIKQNNTYQLQLINTNNIIGEIVIDNAQLVDQFFEYELQQNGGDRFILYSCNDNELSIHLPKNVTNDVTLHFSKHGYIGDADSCTQENSEQICNVQVTTEQGYQSVTLPKGMWRVHVFNTEPEVEENQQINIKRSLYFNQTEILQGIIDGSILDVNVPKIQLCPVVIQYDFSSLLDLQYEEQEQEDGTIENVMISRAWPSGLENIGIAMTQDNQIRDGFATGEFFTNFPFNDSNSRTSSTNGFIDFTKGPILMEFRKGAYENNTFFIMVKQGQQQKSILENNEENTLVHITSIQNTQQKGLGNMIQPPMLVPVSRNETDEQLVEAATIRAYYNFYNNPVSISNYKNLQNNDELSLRLNYAFYVTTASYGFDMELSLYGLENVIATIDQAYDITTDSGNTGRYMQFQMANETNILMGQIERLQTLYLKSTFYNDGLKQQQVQEQLQAPKAGNPIQFVANTILTVEPNTQFSFGSQDATVQVNMKINVTREMVEEKQVIVNMKSCAGATAYLYWSKKNPMVNKYEYYGNQTIDTLPKEESIVIIPIESMNDNVYVNAYSSKMRCQDILIQVFTPSQEPQIEYLNKRIHTTIEPGKEVKYMVSVNENIRNQQFGYLKVELENESEEEEYQISGIVTKYATTSTIENVDEQELLGRFVIDTAQNIQMVNLQFKNQQKRYTYVTFKNNGEKDVNIVWQMTHPDELINQNTVVRYINDNYTIVRADVQPFDTVQLNITLQDSNMEAYLYACPYEIPFFDEIQIVCQDNETTKLFQGSINTTIQNQKNYPYSMFFAIGSQNKSEQSLVTIKSKIDHNLQVNKVNQIPLNGYKTYYSIKLDYTQQEKQEQDQYISLAIKQSQNVAICASLDHNQPEFFAWQQQNEQCTIIIGNTSTQQQYELSKYIHLSNKNKKYLYLTIINLGAPGTTQELLLKVDYIYNAEIGNVNYYNMIYNSDETVENQYPPNVNLMFQIDTTQLDEEGISSLLVQSNKSDAMYFMMGAPVDVFISFTNPTPLYDGSQYNFTLNKFSGSITIPNSIILQHKNEETNKSILFVTVFLLEQNYKQFNGQTIVYSVALQTENKQRIVQKLELYTGQTSLAQFMMGEAGEIQQYSFNVTYIPMRFYLEVCQGDPTFKAGYSNFFYDQEFNNTIRDGAYEVWAQTNRSEQEDTTFNLAPGSRHNQIANYYLQVGDLEHDWKAKMFVGTSDPRPSAAIRTLSVKYVENQKIQIRFSPAISGQISGDEQQLEYAIFAIQDNGDQQVQGLNPKSSCGFLHGYQLTQFQSFDQYNTWYTIKTTQEEYTQSVQQLQQFDKFYITVVVRDSITNLTNMYQPIQTTFEEFKNMTYVEQEEEEQGQEEEQEQQNPNKLSTGGIVGIVIAVIVVIVIIVVAVIYFTKKGKSQQQVQQTSQEQQQQVTGATQMV